MKKETFTPDGWVTIKPKSSKQKTAYMVVNKNGNPLVLSERLPIYWYKRIAKSIAEKHNAFVIKINITP